MSKPRSPFTFEFLPRPLLDTDDLKEYIIMCKDTNEKYHCYTNITDPVKIAGYKEMMQVAFVNSFVEMEMNVIENGNRLPVNST
jgi:hypothetical protein